MATPPKAPKSTKAPTKSSAAKTPSTRLSLKSLQSEMTSIEARLKQNQAKTQRQVKGLSHDFDALANATHSHNAESRAALNAHIQTLAEKLQSDLVESQQAVSQGLAKALNNPTLENLARAIDTANDRLDQFENSQGVAVAKINRNLADLALAVDARLSAESKSRLAAMAAMKQAQDGTETRLSRAIMETDERMMLRLTELEAENAKALTMMGDKVVALADDINARAEDGEHIIKERVTEIGLQTQAEMDAFKANLQRRLDAIEEQLHATDGQLNRSVNSLTSRLEGLEYGLTTTPVSAIAETPSYPPAPSLVADDNDAAAPFVPATPYVPAVESQPPTPPVDNQAAQQPDAFSPDTFATEPLPVAPPAMPMQAPMGPTPAAENPYAAPVYPAQAAPLPLENAVSTGQAIPYDPAAYAQTDYSQAPVAPEYASQPQQVYAQAPVDDVPTLANMVPPYPHSQDMEAPEAQAYVAPATTRADLLPIENSPLPYADPAYAEASVEPAAGAESMEAARPGVFKSKKHKKVKTPKAPKTPSNITALMTPRNKRIGAMVAGLGVITLVATQTVLKPASNPTLQDPFGGPLAVAEIDAESGALQTEPAIGQYADNRAPVIKTDTPAGSALEQAAKSGDAVAQLQLGLSKLEMGDSAAGIALIRQSADQGQPAALYRLAKLYETGEGVGQDANTARSLTERAANGGNRIAMHDLALYFAEGRGGVDVNMGQAAKWFQEAAQRGVVDSQFNLGVLFESGQGVDRNADLAFYWYSVAAAQGDQTAAARVGILRGELPEANVAETDKRVAVFKQRQIDALANGIFKDMPWGGPKSGNGQKVSSNAAAEAKQTIAKTQTLLSNLGYEVGAADGAIGPKTRSAIISFERANGMPETGRVNANLIGRLELAAGA